MKQVVALSLKGCEKPNPLLASSHSEASPFLVACTGLVLPVAMEPKDR